MGDIGAGGSHARLRTPYHTPSIATVPAIRAARYRRPRVRSDLTVVRWIRDLLLGRANRFPRPARVLGRFPTALPTPELPGDDPRQGCHHDITTGGRRPVTSAVSTLPAVRSGRHRSSHVGAQVHPWIVPAPGRAGPRRTPDRLVGHRPSTDPSSTRRPPYRLRQT
ncbi:hypothetical protein FRAAL1426 [Frankia alni ACN14a]|uniref:Uncharacterized protein n=1 Tax=Frankia alni (strain DSM 45986 / CECT 9034 / ACN14a) TaxID=326424 RepID=Q0RQT9_FRAAA|nr:hypothetical protein FRAAL1426 [Frankia alni ACN14a]